VSTNGKKVVEKEAQKSKEEMERERVKNVEKEIR
jgi:hypothetical protein